MRLVGSCDVPDRAPPANNVCCRCFCYQFAVAIYVSDHTTCATCFEILSGIYWRNFSVIYVRRGMILENIFFFFEKRKKMKSYLMLKLTKLKL